MYVICVVVFKYLRPKLLSGSCLAYKFILCECLRTISLVTTIIYQRWRFETHGTCLKSWYVSSQSQLPTILTLSPLQGWVCWSEETNVVHNQKCSKELIVGLGNPTWKYWTGPGWSRQDNGKRRRNKQHERNVRTVQVRSLSLPNFRSNYIEHLPSRP